MAPIANSSCPGTPSLRTTNTSSGALKYLATSQATGTPPRGKASTTTSGRLAYELSFSARNFPASLRFLKVFLNMLTFRRQMFDEPARCKVRYFFKCARFLEQMSCTGDNLKFLLTLKLSESLPIHFNHRIVSSADNQKSRRFDQWQIIAGEIWPAAAGNNGSHFVT